MPPGGLPGRGRAQVRGQASLFQASLGQSCYGARRLQVESQASVRGGRQHARFALEPSGPQYNEAFVSAVPAPTSLGNPTPPSSCAPSSFLPGPGGGKGTVCTWMDPMVSWEARAGHSSGTEGEVAFPLLGRDLAGGVPHGRAKATQAPREPPLQDPTQKSGLLSPILPPPLGPREKAGCHGICRHAAMPPACSLGVLQPLAQAARACCSEGKVQGNQPFTVGCWAESLLSPQHQRKANPSL